MATLKENFYKNSGLRINPLLEGVAKTPDDVLNMEHDIRLNLDSPRFKDTDTLWWIENKTPAAFTVGDLRKAKKSRNTAAATATYFKEFNDSIVIKRGNDVIWSGETGVIYDKGVHKKWTGAKSEIIRWLTDSHV